MRIFDLLFPPRKDELLLRDVTPETFLAHAAPALISETRPATLALFSYADPVARAAVHETKYHGSPRAFALLAAALADALPEHLADRLEALGSSPARLAPVPLGPKRRRERGYNQVAEVARRALAGLAGHNIVLDTTALMRVRETPSQISLARGAREENMRGAFGALPPLQTDTIYIVLDDVITTGATLGAALEALAAAGIPRERLCPVALAYQP